MEKEQNNEEKLQPYKGVKDYYPEDFSKLFYLFSNWRKTSQKMGYEEYNSSVLEYSSLYANKTSDEILNEQTYTFEDRGGRSVTLRPEMTPTGVRMIAQKKRDLIFPLRWFCIANIFRYEQPQRGRTRESWQYNADFFGDDSPAADVEVIMLANQILLDLGLTSKDFVIRLNSRESINNEIARLGVQDKSKEILRLMDRKDKDPEFAKKMQSLIGNEKFEPKPTERILKNIEWLKKAGIENVIFDETLVRGFDYYTGMVFEIFDTNPELRRSIAGGGRYDKLFENFGVENIPAVGFGLGNVTLTDSLEVRGLMPKKFGDEFVEIIPVVAEAGPVVLQLMKLAYASNVPVKVNYSAKKIGDAIGKAVKRGARAVILIGEEEVKKNKVTVKDLKTEKQKVLNVSGAVKFISKILKK